MLLAYLGAISPFASIDHQSVTGDDPSPAYTLLSSNQLLLHLPGARLPSTIVLSLASGEHVGTESCFTAATATSDIPQVLRQTARSTQNPTLSHRVLVVSRTAPVEPSSSAPSPRSSHYSLSVSWSQMAANFVQSGGCQGERAGGGGGCCCKRGPPEGYRR